VIVAQPSHLRLQYTRNMANHCIHQPGRAAGSPHEPEPAGRARPAGDACVGAQP